MILQGQPKAQRRLGLLFTLPLGFSLGFFIFTVLSERADIGLSRIRNLSAGIAQLRMLADDVESSERSYLLTGDDTYLAPLRSARATIPSQIATCRRYAKDENADLQRETERLAALATERLREAEAVLDTERKLGPQPALDLAKSERPRATMDSLRLAMNALNQKLELAQNGYLGRQRRLNQWAFVFFIVGALAMIALMAWIYNALLSSVQVRDQAIANYQSLNRELEAHVEERTRDLTQANEELQQFAYVASHDLQEPLRTITSFTQLLEERYRGRLDEDANEFIDYIVASSRRMSDLINGLLALARLRKTGQPTVPISFDKLVEEAEMSLQGAIRESQARIERGPLPSLAVDRMQFLQVLQNLFSNAIKYRRDEPPLIRIDAKRDHSNWIFSVTDNSRGFDQHFADRIFAMFQRLNTREVQGTGMGLSIAKKVVERHGGRIWAQSMPGVGSTFYFTLPVSLEVAHQHLEPEISAAATQK